MPSKDVQEFKQEVAASRTAVGEKHSDWWQVTNSLVIHVNWESLFFEKTGVLQHVHVQNTCYV